MKRSARIIAFLLALVLTAAPLCAWAYSPLPSLSSLSDNELLELKALLDAELIARGLDSGTNATITSTQTDHEPLVWIPKSGSKYHSKSTCSNMKGPSQVSLDVAKSLGYTPCKRCNPPK